MAPAYVRLKGRALALQHQNRGVLTSPQPSPMGREPARENKKALYCYLRESGSVKKELHLIDRQTVFPSLGGVRGGQKN